MYWAIQRKKFWIVHLYHAVLRKKSVNSDINSQLQEKNKNCEIQFFSSQLPFYLIIYLVEETGFRCKQTY